MTTYYNPKEQPQMNQNPYPPAQDLHRNRRPKSKRWILAAAAGALLFVAGIGIGGASAQPEVKEVEKRVEVPGPERTIEVEKRVEVPVVPQECLTALKHADAGFANFADVLQAILDNDAAAADAINAELSALAPKYNAAKASCRAAG